ncbi:MAG TPA: hypothetical protein VEQ60_30910, partial [Longimicrobium sp.]|nr:hypothetical protein [Longimicrobium sp.]
MSSRNRSAPRSRARPRAPQPAAPAPATPWRDVVRPWHAAVLLAVLHAMLALLMLDPSAHHGGD